MGVEEEAGAAAAAAWAAVWEEAATGVDVEDEDEEDGGEEDDDSAEHDLAAQRVALRSRLVVGGPATAHDVRIFFHTCPLLLLLRFSFRVCGRLAIGRRDGTEY